MTEHARQDLQQPAGWPGRPTDNQGRSGTHVRTAPSTPAVSAPRRTSRRRLAAAAAAAIAAGTAFIVWEAVQAPALAATPDPLACQAVDGAVPTAERLGQLAAAADRDTPPATSAPTGVQLEHLRIEDWHLFSQITGGTTTSAVVQAERQSWRAADNSGRVTVRYHQPMFRSGNDRRAWQDNGSPGADTDPRTEDYPPGAFPATWADRPPTALLDRWLRRNHAANAWPAAAATAIADLLRERVLASHERAAVIRLLARLPGVEFTGAVADRAGRRGEAFSTVSDYSGLPTRYTFVLDPTTGRFLANEQTLTTTARRLNVSVPAVIGYETYLVADQVMAR